MYKVIVFVKQVPDTKNVTGDAMKPDGTVNRAALPAIFNPEDLNAVELALQIKDNYQDVKVVVATMGPPNAAKVLRDAMCMGADEAVLLTDRAFAGSDTLATSYALHCVAKKIGDFDLVLCGRQAIDGGADIVFGHHSHTLQWVEPYNGGIIYYSLGNFSFGGNGNPSDKDSAIIQQHVLRYEDGTIALGDLDISPCRVSSVTNWNDYRPTPMEEGTEEYLRALQKLEGSYDGEDHPANYPPMSSK